MSKADASSLAWLVEYAPVSNFYSSTRDQPLDDCRQIIGTGTPTSSVPFRHYFMQGCHGLLS